MFTPRPNSLLAIAGADVPLESKRTNNRILSEEEEWYYHGPNKSRRYRYNFCGDCAYKTFSRHSLVLHIDLHHPYSTTALPPRRRQKPLKTGRQNLVNKKRPKRQVKGINKRSFDHCKYKTDQKHELEKHEMTHQSKINDHCLFCSKTIKLLSAHLKKDHPERNELINQVRSMSNFLYLYSFFIFILYFLSIYYSTVARFIHISYDGRYERLC